MTSAIFVVPFRVGVGPTIAVDPGKTDGYGYSVIGQVPQAPTCLVRVWSDDATLDALAADPDTLYVEDCPNDAL